MLDLTRLVYAVALGVMLTSCSSSAPPQSQSWNTYRNPRFSFEFPYPSNWVAAASPTNGDGQAFSDPQQPGVEIRGWAGYQLSGNDSLGPGKKLKAQQPLLKPNFTTEQGLSGELKVEVGSEMSSISLALVQGDVQYNWRGQASSKLFDHYYKFFYYVASQYRVLPQPKQPG